MRPAMKHGGIVVLGFTRHSGQSKEGLIEVLTEAGLAGTSIIDSDHDFCVPAIKP